MITILIQESEGFFIASLSFPHSRLCRNCLSSLRATVGSVAIFMFSMPYEIASVVTRPRNDLMTQPEGGNAEMSFRLDPLLAWALR